MQVIFLIFSDNKDNSRFHTCIISIFFKHAARSKIYSCVDVSSDKRLRIEQMFLETIAQRSYRRYLYVGKRKWIKFIGIMVLCIKLIGLLYTSVETANILYSLLDNAWKWGFIEQECINLFNST